MAALKIVRDTSLAADLRQIVGRFHLHRETVLPQIVRVAFAASALRVLVERDLLRGDRCGIQAHRKDSGSTCGAEAGKSKYLFHRFFPFRRQ